MESSIPVGMTIEQWRRQRPARSRPRRRRSARTVAEARHLAPVPEPAPCDHLCDTTTRYDAAQKLLTFLLVCPTCGTEKLIDTVRYEPRFEPHANGRARRGDRPPAEHAQTPPADAARGLRLSATAYRAIARPSHAGRRSVCSFVPYERDEEAADHHHRLGEPRRQRRALADRRPERTDRPARRASRPEDAALQPRARPRAGRSREGQRGARLLRGDRGRDASGRARASCPRSASARRCSRASRKSQASSAAPTRSATRAASRSSSTPRRATTTWSATTRRRSSFATRSSSRTSSARRSGCPTPG